MNDKTIAFQLEAKKQLSVKAERLSATQLEAKKQLSNKAELVAKQQLESKKQLAKKTDLVGKQQLEAKKQLSEKTAIVAKQQLEDIGISRNDIPHVVAGLVPSNIETSIQDARISAHAARLLRAARFQ